MWASITDGKLVKIISHPKSMVINNVQYSKAIFSSAWSNEERKAIGILPYEYSGSRGDNMFYTSSESEPVVQSDKVVVTWTKTARDINKIKDTMKAHVSDRLKSYLEQCYLTKEIFLRRYDYIFHLTILA